MKISVGLPKDKVIRRVLIAAAAASVLTGIQPWLWDQVFAAASRYRDRQTQEEQLKNVKELADQVRTIDPGEAVLLDQAEIPFPLTGRTPQIVERLEGLAEGRNLQISLASITEQPNIGERRPGGLTALDVAFLVQGPVRQMLAFFDALEHMPELTQVLSWGLRPAETGGGFALHMQVRFFLWPRR